VHRDIKDVFVAKVAAAARAYAPGNPLDPSVTMGPIVDRIQFERVAAYIDAGRREGRLVTGGARVREETGGFYVEPTVFEVKPNAKIAREEIFGPVLSVIEFAHADEAVRIANDTEYGLAAAVWSGDLTTAHEVARRLRAGTVWINGYNEGGGEMSFPFGGYKQSGNGRDKSLHALEKYTELKSTIVRLR
jgi:4-(gamma-glutamylamino)butanal dehydrogenase